MLLFGTCCEDSLLCVVFCIFTVMNSGKCDIVNLIINTQKRSSKSPLLEGVNSVKAESSNHSIFASRLVQLRHLSGMKQREMAQFLNLDRSTYTYYENDKTRPDFQTLIRIARIFNVSIDYLLGMENTDKQATRVYSTPIEYGPLNGASVLSTLPEDEQTILVMYRQLDANSREALLQYILNQLNTQYTL